MTLEKITKQAFLKLMADQSFENDEDMKKFLIPELRKMLLLTDPDRVTEDDVKVGENVYGALHVLDKESMHDVLLAVVYSAKDFPDKVEDEFESHWSSEDAKYGVMLTPTSCRIFEIKDGEEGREVLEVEEMRPLEELDYEDEKAQGSRKYWYWALNNKVMVFGFIIFVFMLVGLKGTAALLCRVNGKVITNITEDGAYFYMPTDKGYDPAMTGDAKGERRYCDPNKAMNDGWLWIGSK